MLPSGKTTVVQSRVGWALAYMKQAGLLGSSKRGVYQIAERGRAVLNENPEVIDLGTLERFSEFLEFRARSRPPAVPSNESMSPPEVQSLRVTPEETLENA
jgi:restriction system protein